MRSEKDIEKEAPLTLGHVFKDKVDDYQLNRSLFEDLTLMSMWWSYRRVLPYDEKVKNLLVLHVLVRGGSKNLNPVS